VLQCVAVCFSVLRRGADLRMKFDVIFYLLMWRPFVCGVACGEFVKCVHSPVRRLDSVHIRLDSVWIRLDSVETFCDSLFAVLPVADSISVSTRQCISVCIRQCVD